MGYGMPIGCVIAALETIIPNAVGVAIGCGVVFFKTNIPVQLVRECRTPQGQLLEVITKNILREIPVGFSHHQKKQESAYLSNLLAPGSAFNKELTRHPQLADLCFPSAFKQLGTLGGGNHFIELQEDEEGTLCVMLHSGSRNVGKQVCDYFNRLAKKLNESWGNPIPPSYQLAYFPVTHEEGQSYLRWMNMCLNFARENRELIKERVKSIIARLVDQYAAFDGVKFGMEINAHHNYASLETHYGKEVWVHRKGAISARKGELGIVPGAMGRASYIVRAWAIPSRFAPVRMEPEGKMGRRAALATYSEREVLKELKEQSVVLETPSTKRYCG